MTRSGVITVLLALATLVAIVPSNLGQSAPNDPSGIPENPPLGMDPSTLEVGETGWARTVLEGDRLEDVPVRYIGLMEDFAGPGYDLLLVELEGPVGDHIGIASGMSGSPVYFRGRLVGALSYSIGSFPKEAIGGVTPIETMLAARRSASTGNGDGLVRPIATPIHAQGLHPAVRDWLAPQFEEMGFQLVPGGGAVQSGAGGGTAATVELVPGSAVGVGLADGDMTLGASGTVTWVDDDRVYGFGHPFLGQGRVNLPMHQVRVLHTLADQAGSFKMTNIGEPIGIIDEDRLTAIVGRLGGEAETFPIRLGVRGGSFGDQTFRFRVVRTSPLMPLAAASTIANGMLSNLGFEQQSTIRARGVIRLRDLPDLKFENAASSVSGSPGFAVAAQAQLLLNALRTNALGPVVVEGLEVDVDVVDAPIRYRLKELLYDRGALRPGQTLEVGCLLERHRGGTTTHTLRIQIPADLEPGTELRLAVGPPDQVDRALGRPAQSRVDSARSLDALVRALDRDDAANRLRAVVYTQAGTVVSQGVEYTDLPPTAMRLLSTKRSSARSRVSGMAVLQQVEQRLDGPIVGGLLARLRLDSGLEPVEGTDE